MRSLPRLSLVIGWLVTALLVPLILNIADAQTLRERLQARRAQSQTDAPTNQPITGPGDYRFTLQSGGIERRYRVHVPRGYDAAHPAPMVMAFHGGGGNMDFEADDSHYGLESASDAHGFIAVFPNGVGALGGRLATWNAGKCCGMARDQGVDDVAFVRAVAADVETKAAIDMRRVYATGMSNGGMLVQRLACEAADVFRAVAPVAGTDNTRDCHPARPVPIIEFHARDDDHVLFDGGAGKDAFRNRSAVTEFTSVPETISRWVRRNRCNVAARRVLDKPGAYCEVHEGCADGATVELCVTETGGHSWPGAGSVRADKAPASQAISADALMWDFFTSH